MESYIYNKFKIKIRSLLPHNPTCILIYSNICVVLPPYFIKNHKLVEKEKSFNHLEKCGHILTENDNLSKLTPYLTWAKMEESNDIHLSYVDTILKKLKNFTFIFTTLNFNSFKKFTYHNVVLLNSFPTIPNM